MEDDSGQHNALADGLHLPINKNKESIITIMRLTRFKDLMSCEIRQSKGQQTA